MAFNVSLDLSKGKAATWPYWHIDLNAGCGWNEVVDCEGSPLVFLREAEHAERRFNAVFCDLDAEAVRSLEGRLPAAPAGCVVRTFAGDNADALDAFGNWIVAAGEKPQYAVGTCLADPNGVRSLPIDGLARFASAFPRIDLIVNLNISLFSRFRGGRESPALRGRFDKYPEPLDLLALFHRKHWVVRNLPRGGTGERFTLAVGRSHRAGSGRHADFYPIDSPAGRRILQDFRREIPEQMDLFER